MKYYNTNVIINDGTRPFFPKELSESYFDRDSVHMLSAIDEDANQLVSLIVYELEDDGIYVLHEVSIEDEEKAADTTENMYVKLKKLSWEKNLPIVNHVSVGPDGGRSMERMEKLGFSKGEVASRELEFSLSEVENGLHGYDALREKTNQLWKIQSAAEFMESNSKSKLQRFLQEQEQYMDFDPELSVFAAKEAGSKNPRDAKICAYMLLRHREDDKLEIEYLQADRQDAGSILHMFFCCADKIRAKYGEDMSLVAQCITHEDGTDVSSIVQKLAPNAKTLSYVYEMKYL